MTIRAVIFDRDGVLTQFDIDAVTAFLQPRLHMSTLEVAQRWIQWNSLMSTPTSEAEEAELLHGFWKYIGDLAGVNETVQQELFAFDYVRVIQPYYDAATALQWCQQKELKVGVLSNFSLVTLDQTLEAGGLRQWIDYAAAAPIIGYAKPHPQSFYYIIEKLDVLPEECLLIDDEPSYVEAAWALNMNSFLLNRRLLAHDLEQHKICDLTALPQILDKLQFAKFLPSTQTQKFTAKRKQ